MADQTYTASCFGKLPNFGDFVKYKASSSEMQAFDIWLQQGMIAAKRQLDTMFDSCWNNDTIYYFLFYPPNAKQFLIGVFKTSFDKSERRFPYIITLQVPVVVFNDNYNIYIPLIFNSFLEKTNNLLNQNLHELSFTEIRTEIENLAVPVISDYSYAISEYNEFLTNTTSEQFLSSQFGDFNNIKKYIVFSNLVDILIPLRKRDISSIPVGYQIPMNHRGFNTTYSICFWQQLIHQLSGHSKNVLPNLIWTDSQTDDQSNLYVYFRVPPARFFINLLKPDFENDIIYRLENPGSQDLDKLKNKLSENHKYILENNQILLKNFLENI